MCEAKMANPNPNPNPNPHTPHIQIKFLFDDTIFAKGVSFDADVIRSRIRELAFLNSGMNIRLRWAGVGSGSWPS